MAGKLSYEELEQKVKELEKKAVEYEKVKDALKLFSHAFESSIDGLAMGNNENRFTYTNETFAKMFGYSREELVGKEIALIYADDQIPLLEEALKITMEGGWTGELIGKKKDGTRFPVSISSTRVLDDKGNVITHMASHRDITQEKQTVETLRESEEKYRTLFEDSRDAITICTRNGKYIAFNQSFLDLFGYTKEDMRDMRAEEKYLDPNDRATFKKEVEEKGSVKGFEVMLKKKDGTKIYALITATLWTAPDGSFQGYQNIVRDITEQRKTLEALRESEKKWRTLFENSRDAIFVTTRNGEFIDFNQSFLDLFGYTEEEIKKSNSIERYAHPNDRVTFKKAVEEKGSVKDFEVTLKKKDGTKIYALMTATLWPAHDGSILGYQGITRDVTEQKQTLEALRESEEKWRSLAETAPCIILTVQQDGTIQFLNRIVGTYTPENTIGTKVWEYVPPDHHSVMKKAIEHVFQTGSPISYEILGAGPEGPASAWYMTQLGPILKDGKVAAVTMAATDIAEIKKVHEELRESEAQKKAILNASIERIRLSDTDMRIIWANQAHERELNIHPEELIGQRCYTVFFKRDIPCSECPSMKALRSGKIEHSILTRHSPENKDETTYLDSYAVPLKDEAGDIVKCIQITRNITEQVRTEKALQKSEEKYRTILENIEEGCYEVDLAGNFTFLNDSICKMLGYRRDELLGMNNREYTDEKTAKKIYKISSRVHKTGKPKNIVSFEIMRKNGDRRNVAASVSLMKDSKGNATGFRGMLRDVTEHKRAEAAIIKRETELAKLNKQLIETNRALSVLAKNLDITQKESEKRVVHRIRSYIIPIIEKLRQDKNIERYRADFDLLTSYIRDLTSELANDIKIALALSTTELRVASLIRNGMSNQEIAKHLYITLSTVKTHRRNIRRKLDLHNSGINLKSYMKSELNQE
jgi:PAS domain S-box-containing protein